MKHAFTFWAVLLFFASAAVAQDISWEYIDYQELHESVVFVGAGDSCGTGVIVQIGSTIESIESKGVTRDYRDGYILTCFHVAENCNSNDLIIGFTDKCIVRGKLVVWNCKEDVALISCKIPANYKPVTIATRFPEGGDSLTCVGLGGDCDIQDPDKIRRFKIIVSDMSSPDMIRSDACLIPGDSGGPVFNEEGELVGLLHGGYELHPMGMFEQPAVWPFLAVGLRNIANIMAKLPESSNLGKDGDP